MKSENGSVVPQTGESSKIDFELRKFKTFSFIFVTIFLVLLIAIVGYFVIQRLAKKQDLTSPETSRKEQTDTTTIIDWQDRILYTSRRRLDGQLSSMNLDGTQVRQHPFMCDGETVTAIRTPFKSLRNIARSPDGKSLAFILPLKETRQKNPNWRQDVLNGSEKISNGIIYLYDLRDDTCISTELSADNLYSQNIAFSPDGHYVAYVFYGLHIYDLKTGKDTPLTSQEGSARVPEVILGPLAWNQKSTAVYMPVAKDVAQDVTRVNLVKVNIPQATSQTVMKLPDYYSPEAIEKLQPYQNDSSFDDFADAVIPDKPSLFAISPDEQKVLIEKDGDLVMQSLSASAGTTNVVYNRSAPRGYAGRLKEVTWLPSGWIVYTYNPPAPAASSGGEEASFNGDTPISPPGYDSSADLNGTNIVYNFEYYGTYYRPPSTPRPSGFRPGHDDAGHKYDGIGAYDLTTKDDVKLSGKDKPVGDIWTWFW